MATHSSVLAWRIPGTTEPGGLLSVGSHRVGHDWSDLAAAAAATTQTHEVRKCCCPNGEYGLDWLRLAINHQCEKSKQNKTGVSSNLNEAKWTKTEMCHFFPVNMENCRHNEKQVILTGNSPEEKSTHWNYKREIRLQMNHQKVCFVLNSTAHYILEN